MLRRFGDKRDDPCRILALGWLLDRRSSGLVAAEMKNIRLALYFAIGLLLGAVSVFSHAASYTRSSNPGWSSGYGWRGNGNVSGGSAQTTETINVGGTYIPVPFAGPLGAAALETIITGIKATPAALATGVVINWLAGQGIEWMQGQFMKKGQSDSYPAGVVTPGVRYCYTDVCGLTGQAACDAVFAKWAAEGVPSTLQTVEQTANGFMCRGTNGYNAGAAASPYCPHGSYGADGMCHVNTCDAPYVMENDRCVIPVGYQPVPDSDWDKVFGIPAPDAVMNDLCKRLAALGSACKAESLSGQAVTAPLSNPQSSGPGKSTQQVATLTPSPTPNDPTRTRVEVSNSETQTGTDANGNPTSETTTTPENNPDFCVLHPESIACASLGEVEDQPALTEKQVGVSSVTVTPFGSAASCPAPIQLPHGASLSFEWPCRMAEGVKPFLLVLAWLAAGFIVVGALRNE